MNLVNLYIHERPPLGAKGFDSGTSGKECWGNSSGSGDGYAKSCIHSGTIADIDVNTNWYNYALASAGTITGASNTTIIVQNICPKGWTLPNKVQVLSNKNVNIFSPVYGGYYYNAEITDEFTRGRSWSSEAYSNVSRHTMTYGDGILYIGNDLTRSGGQFICYVQSS